MNAEVLYTMALTRLAYFSPNVLHELYTRVGSAEEVVHHRNNIGDILPDAGPRLISAFKNMDEALKRAEEEMRWCEENKIEPIIIADERYPQRLTECNDAPLVLYYRGNADMNARHVISVIGTRHSTIYGHDIICKMMSDLKEMCPDLLVMSGLAYGVDIDAHREALRNGFPTIGVLAHGLDMIYPNAHRSTAIEMLNNGGLLTEYMRGTPGAKGNFVQRNRIVAGMCDACILVESAAKGGGLITMSIARDYGRDTFAFPGPVKAEYSKGCNNIIRDNGAQLITCAEDLVKAMGWCDDKVLEKAKQEGIEREIFPDLSDEERIVVKALQEENDMQINVMTVRTGIPVYKLTSMLFTLEMKGVIKTMAGGCYHLI